MCGIAGQFSYAAQALAVDPVQLRKVRDAMQQRGPDGAGLWLDAEQRIGLAHRRLSIIDLSAASDQPFWHHTKKALLVFNGEIYNYRALRDELIGLGARFESQGDTEVVAEVLHRFGVPGLSKLRGMFAIAYCDLQRRELILARDSYGIKPLYVADKDGTIYFASSLKALAKNAAISLQIDPLAEVGFLLTGSVPEPHTFLSEVKALAPGSAMLINEHQSPKVQVFDELRDAYLSKSTADGERNLPQAISDSVRWHLEADVPVACFLSAGVDSGALLALMRDTHAAQINTVTVRFKEFANQAVDEGPIAAQLSNRYGSKHHEVWVSEAEFAADIDHFLAAMDQPSIDGMNTWMVSKATRQLGLKVALSGLGGDELLGGYSNFDRLPKWLNWQHRLSSLPLLMTGLRAVAPTLSRLGLHPKARGLLQPSLNLGQIYDLKRGLFLPHELAPILGAGFNDSELLNELVRQLETERAFDHQSLSKMQSDFARISWLESSRYMRNQLLRDSDWASMAHSVEIRVPLVDRVLLSAVQSQVHAVQRQGGKSLLANAAKLPLPEQVVQRKKTGFTTPVALWQQKIPQLQGWRSINALQAENTPWARRYALAVLHQQRAAFAALKA